MENLLEQIRRIINPSAKSYYDEQECEQKAKEIEKLIIENETRFSQGFDAGRKEGFDLGKEKAKEAVSDMKVQTAIAHLQYNGWKIAKSEAIEAIESITYKPE